MEKVSSVWGTCHFILKNPFYCGVFKYKGELYQGKHEPIITKKLFDQAQEMLKKRGRSHEKKIHNYIFTNFMKCGNCGCAITAEKHKGHIYYRCTKKKGPCSEKYLREEELKEQMLSEVKKVSCLPDGWPNKMLERLEIDKKESFKAKTGEIGAFTEKVKIVRISWINCLIRTWRALWKRKFTLLRKRS